MARPGAAVAVVSPGLLRADASPDRVAAAGRQDPDPRARRLGIGHFAFMRALVQGLPLRESWERYLHVEGSSSDLRLVRGTIQWLRDAFAAAARREQRHGTARLVLLDASRLPDAGPEVPSLEAFAAGQGIEDFSQAEQLEAFEAAHGKASQRQARRARLVARQLEALRWLEALAARLNPSIALRLEATGIVTLAQLLERINGMGRGWTASIRGVGAAKAERVVRWLAQHQATIGIAVGSHVALPRKAIYRHELQRVVAPATGVRPLEKLVVPVELDGSRGAFRRPQAHCLLAASNDYEALLAWLRSKAGPTPEQREAAKARRRGRNGGIDGPLEWLSTLSHTQRAYRKEAERFLLWAVVERGRALSSMTTEDCVAYREFLADPQPSSRWCAQRNRERWSPLWRPFEGPLAPSAQRQAVHILKNLYAFWVDKNYAMGNPWTGVAVPRSAQPRMNTGRSLTMAQWRLVLDEAAEQPDVSTARRLRFALSLLYATGLRLSEAVAARVDHLEWVEYPPDADDEVHVEGWLLNVVGKGSRLRQVPVPADVVAELLAYLASRGLEPDPTAAGNTGAFLLGKARDLGTVAAARQPEGPDPRAGIAANTLYDQLKRFFGQCAGVLEGQGDARGAARLARASTHWLRHTHASHSIARGTHVEIAQQILGHASLSTTTAYVTTEGKRRMKAIDAFWRR